MKYIGPLYFCTECKKVVDSLEQLLFVEDSSQKGFCSETCIEDFYSPIITHFSNVEKKLRSELALEYELISEKREDKKLIEVVLANPDQVWSIPNLMSESITVVTKKIDDYTALILCLMYKNEASFIFLLTKTQSEALVSSFRSHNLESLESLESDVKQGLSEEDFAFVQLLESKKSKLLADLLTKRSESDIDFENFPKYENFFEECLHHPDEVYETKDNEGDIFFNYIKSFNRNHESFFYIISCLRREESDNSSEVNVYPVLAFPTNDVNLYAEFCIGTKISGHLKN